MCVCVCVCVCRPKGSLSVSVWFSSTCVGLIERPYECSCVCMQQRSPLVCASLLKLSHLRLEDTRVFLGVFSLWECVLALSSLAEQRWWMVEWLWNMSPVMTPMAFHTHIRPTLFFSVCVCVSLWPHILCLPFLQKNPYNRIRVRVWRILLTTSSCFEWKICTFNNNND